MNLGRPLIYLKLEKIIKRTYLIAFKLNLTLNIIYKLTKQNVLIVKIKNIKGFKGKE